MFRHITYHIIANDSDKDLENLIINHANTIGFSYHYEKHIYYITVNGNWALDHKAPFNKKVLAKVIRESNKSLIVLK